MTKTDPVQPRAVQPRLWQGLAASGAIALATVPALVAGHADHRSGMPRRRHVVLPRPKAVKEEKRAQSKARTRMWPIWRSFPIVEGHLVAALDLYRKGMVDEAVGLSYHPEAEMMDVVRESLVAHGVPDVTPAMTAFSATMEAGAPLPDVEAALAAAQAAFATAAAPEADEVKVRADALVLVVRAAAHEYEESTEGGVVGDVMAYHEAHAFIDVARTLATALAADPAAKAQSEKVLVALDGAAEAFGDMSGTALEAKDPAILMAVAAKVELALSSVR